MRIRIIDDNHIMIVASEAECNRYQNHTRVFIDNKDTFVCCSEPSSSAFIISRGDGDSILNVPLDITNSAFTTDDLLIVYLEMPDYSYPIVLPSYNNGKILLLVANKVGIVGNNPKSLDNYTKAYPIVIYYAFKLALSITDIKTAINYWNRLFDIDITTSKCNCNGH